MSILNSALRAGFDLLLMPFRDMPWWVGLTLVSLVASVAMLHANGIERTLVGFRPLAGDAPAPKECHLVIRDGEITGRVTSCAYSPTLDSVIGLAYVATDQAEPGGRFDIKVEGGEMVEAEVVTPPFYDAEGKRQEM